MKRISITILILLSLFSNIVFGQDEQEETAHLYRVVAVSKSDNTIRSESNEVEIYLPMKVYLPTAFTPNGDGLNDQFSIREVKSPCNFEGIGIYNRWGQEVFSSKDPDFRWEALDVPAGQYMYHLRFEGTEYKGIVNLIR